MPEVLILTRQGKEVLLSPSRFLGHRDRNVLRGVSNFPDLTPEEFLEEFQPQEQRFARASIKRLFEANLVDLKEEETLR